MPAEYKVEDEFSDVLRGIRYHESLPAKERDQLTREIDGYIHSKSKFYPDKSTGALPDSLQRRIDKEQQKLFDDFDSGFNEDDIEKEFDPIPDLGISFD